MAGTTMKSTRMLQTSVPMPRSRFRRTCHVLALASAVLLFSGHVEANFRNAAQLKWRYDLPTTGAASSTRVQRGNAVKVSQDGSRVFVTESDGSLHIVRTGDLSRSTRYRPTPFPEATTTTSTSGVALIESATSINSAIYSVVDTKATGDVTSRIIAVDKDGSDLWAVEVSGAAVGTPFVSGDQSRIYVAHNEQNNSRGRMSVIRIVRNAASVTAEVTASLPSNGGLTPLPLGAPTGRTITQGGDTRDIIVVAEGDFGSAGDDDRGSLYVVVQSEDFDRLNGQGDEAYDLRLVSDYPLMAIVRPALGLDGTDVYLAHGNRLTGWDGERDISRIIDGSDEDVFPEWEQRYEGTREDESAPIPTPPILSPDGTLLLVMSASGEVTCLDIERDRLEWVEDIGGTSVAEPIVSNIQNARSNVVYYVQTAGGIVRQVDIENGNTNWEMGCAEVTGEANCDLSVEADFSMSSTGNSLFYSYSNGTIVALSVATFQTAPPTPFPTGAPSAIPLAAPSAAPAPVSTPTGVVAAPVSSQPGDVNVPVGDPDQKDTPGAVGQPNGSSGSGDSNLPVILGATVGGLAALVAVALLFLCRRKLPCWRNDEKMTRKDKEESLRWQQEQRDYEDACADLERETLKEINESPGTPAGAAKKATRKRSMRSGSSSKLTPVTLDSIAESSVGDSESTVSDDDANESGFEISISDKSDLQSMESAPRRSPKESAVRNLSNSFTEAAEEPAAIPVRPKSPPRSPRFSWNDNKPDATPTKGTPPKRRDSNGKGLPETSAVDAGVMDVATVTSAGTEEPGYIPSVKNRAAARPISPLSPSSPVGRSESPTRRPSSPSNRPVSPSFSDIWSVDESLYVDEDRTHATGTKSIDHPDDESGLGPGRIGRAQAGSSLVAQAKPQSTQLKAAPSVPQGHGPQSQSDSRLVVKPGTDRVAAYAAGGRARPKAGLFTRSQPPLSTFRDSQMSSDGYLQEREGRAAYSPSLAQERLRAASTGKSQQAPRGGDQAGTYSPALNAPESAGSYSMWNNFITELAKVEDQFFNPKMEKTKAAHPPPPRNSPRSCRPSSPPPPPPPPPREESSDEGSSDSDYDSDKPQSSR